MDSKKISFGFSRITKKPNFLSNKKDENKLDLIKCFEGQEIKLVEEKLEEAPLVIPMKENQKTSTALASLIKRRAVLLGEDEPSPTPLTEGKDAPAVTATAISNGITENLEQRATRELLADLQSNGETEESSTLVLPVVKPDELPLDGAKESTIDDYDSIPVQHFGMAMLRGMGFVEPPKTKSGGAPIDDSPFVRPKGMGLGADKALKAKPLLVQPEPNEVLEIKKQAYVRILGGKHKDLYGQIEGFDDHAGRVIVRLAIGGAKEAFNEFLCQPVSRKEYAQYGKCINTTKYEEYKKLENEHGQIIIKKEIKEEKEHKKDNERREYKVKEAKEYKDKEEKEYKVKEVKKEKRLDSNHRETHHEDHYYDRKSKFDGDVKMDKFSRKYEDERKKPKPQHEDAPHRYAAGHSSTSRYHRDNDSDHQQQNGSKSKSKFIEQSQEKPRSRSHERRGDSKSQQSGSRRPAQSPSTDDTSESSESDSDSDSAYERKKHKKSNKSKSKKKPKSKKSSKQYRSRHHSPSTSITSATASSSSEDERKRHKSHKKKTKKSKKPRSRTRSRSRGRK